MALLRPGSPLPPIPRPLRVACVNDYEVVVAGVARMLSGYADRVEVVELDQRLPVTGDVDVVLFDTFALHGRSLALPDLVLAGGPKVVVFTWSPTRHAMQAALDGGAAGYLSKALPALALVEALEEIHAGMVVTRTLDGAVPGEGTGDWPGREIGLTPREAEVLALITQGLSNEEITVALDLSLNSLKTYIRFAYRKIGVQRRSQAVLWALRHGFVVDPGRSSPPT